MRVLRDLSTSPGVRAGRVREVAHKLRRRAEEGAFWAPAGSVSAQIRALMEIP